MGFLHDAVERFRFTLKAYAGDEALMQAAVSACANVAVADGELMTEEFETALEGMRANPILEKGYDSLMLEHALYEGLGRARTRAGRAENLVRIAAIADRPEEQRRNVFLIAADVADHEGIGREEDAALAEVAAALGLDKDTLLQRFPEL
ncbi:tellurite resistance TerB family protein [Methylorubrum zatmanii]|uniref:Tellurite resistance TerB family protein n=1 Tax=Methylorubrum zatmanii TaxID=29429 RepID=A0ABW1WU24_9HYPH|nr:tellurite resistance TerB family protein [Methylorubrum zatmanii]MBD8906228.1 Tellurite resistance protein TerB [Methylorubrum zatmanii]